MYRKGCGKMKCKPYEAYGFLIVFGTLWAFCLVGLGITDGREGIIGAFFINIPMTYIILDTVILKWKTITLSKDGCAVKWFMLEKKYKWEELLLISHEYLPGRPSGEGIYFSVKEYKKNGKKVTPKDVRFSHDIFQCFYIFFLDDKDKESVLNYLMECGVNVEKGKNLLEKEKYETMMEVRTKVREKRKRRYLEETNKKG